MSRQKIGQILFWLGVIGVIIMQTLTWLQSPAQRVHTAEELSGTFYAVAGPLWWIRVFGGSGLTLAIVGGLLSTGEKGSYFWLLGFIPGTVMSAGMFWEPSQYMPPLFGVGGAIILLSYFGTLWLWTRTHAKYDGMAKTGKQIQLLGYSFLVTTGLLLCLYFGNPNLLALADQPLGSPESINISLAFGMLLLFVGNYLVAKSSK